MILVTFTVKETKGLGKVTDFFLDGLLKARRMPFHYTRHAKFKKTYSS